MNRRSFLSFVCGAPLAAIVPAVAQAAPVQVLIVDGVITADKICAGSVTATMISANAVVAGKIAGSAITAEKLAVGSISSVRISI